MSVVKKTGWWNPRPMSSSSRFHYFGEDSRSLCGKWAHFGPGTDLDPSMDAHSENCADCKRRKSKLNAAAVSAAVQRQRTKWRVGQKVGLSTWQIKVAPGWKIVHECESLHAAGEWFRVKGVDALNVTVLIAGGWKSLTEFVAANQS